MRILRALAQDARRSWAEIARALGVSQPTIAERVARLRENGVIRGFSVDIDPAALGLPVSALIEFIPTAGDNVALLRFLVDQEEVVSCYAVTGDTLAVLLVRVRDLDHLADFTASLFSKGRTRTLTILKSLEGRGRFATVSPPSDG